ncbi:MAG: hypothetical protein E7290_11810 [Lachnospiraceae bacterium]|nr:hypothetical protein [Lachnospiraceae bacterium]
MKKRKKTLAICLACIFTMLMSMTVSANPLTWTTYDNGVMVIDGTMVTVRVAGDTLYIEGTGEVPDYTLDTLASRPWNGLNFKKVYIAAGITEIGSYAFYGKSNINYVTIPATTFIQDGTSFSGVASDVIFRVAGTGCAYKQFNTILYNSIDSISANTPISYYSGEKCSIIMDNDSMAQQMRVTAYPYLKYVYSAEDKSAPWTSRKDMTDGAPFTSLATIDAASKNTIFDTMTAQIKPQGTQYMETISYFLDGYTYLRAYNMTLTTGSKHEFVKYTTEYEKYVLKLSAVDQVPYREYRLIQIMPTGHILYLEDLDSSKETVTFSTFYPSATYALVYKDNFMGAANGSGSTSTQDAMAEYNFIMSMLPENNIVSK